MNRTLLFKRLVDKHKGIATEILPRPNSFVVYAYMILMVSRLRSTLIMASWFQLSTETIQKQYFSFSMSWFWILLMFVELERVAKGNNVKFCWAIIVSFFNFSYKKRKNKVDVAHSIINILQIWYIITGATCNRWM